MKINWKWILTAGMLLVLSIWISAEETQKAPAVKSDSKKAASKTPTKAEVSQPAKPPEASKTGETVNPSDPTSAQPKKKELYGNMPEELEPYGKFVKEPYKKYFVPSDSAVTFWGPGREKPEPEVDKVNIALLAPMDRSNESYMGKSMYNGTKMAIDEANAQGGYKGKPFNLVAKNDTGLWGASANEIIDFTYEDKCWAVIGTVDGANTHIAIRVALRTDMPMMAVSDLDPSLMETKIPWVFRNVPDDRQMIYTISYYVYKQLGLNKVAILRANNRYGRFGVARFKKASILFQKPAPIEVNYEINYGQVNMDFLAQMNRLKEAQPDGIVLWADAEPAGLLVKKMREMGMNIPIVACERIINPLFLEAAGSSAEGVVATSPYNPESPNPQYQEFKIKYKALFGEEPDTYAAHSYDGTRMVLEAIQKAGLNRYKIRDQLAEMNHWKGVTGEVDYDQVYTNRRPVVVATVQNGHFVYGIPKVDRIF
jgi:branched-chain amino acid transport system substrate-binding protein